MPIDPIDAPVYALLLKIVNALADHTDEVQVTPVPQPEGITVRVKVHHDDVGKLVGKQGRNAKSIRIILSAVGRKSGRRYSLDIVE